MNSLRGVRKGNSAMKKAAVSDRRSAVSEKEAISGQRSAFSENQEPNQEQNQERVRQRAEALVRKIGEACDELEKLAEENPELVGRVTHGAQENKEAYLRLKARLEIGREHV